MRLNQFLDKLAMTPRTWYIDHGYLRMQDVDATLIHCPITAVAKDMGIPDSQYGAQMGAWLGPEIGLSDETAARVFNAADDDHDYPTLRRRLLRACGLTRQGVR